jgi:[ribosomal protein S5]-alanine N-acetyltransferase
MPHPASPIELRLMSLADLRAVAADPLRLRDLQIEAGGLPPPAIVARAMIALDAGRDALWHSFFAYVDAGLGAIVGSGGFKGPPVDGAVEIGYNTAIACRGRGLASEGVSRLVRIAFLQAGVSEVRAETALDNAASRRVLLKAGFRHVGQRASDEDGALDRWCRLREERGGTEADGAPAAGMLARASAAPGNPE